MRNATYIPGSNYFPAAPSSLGWILGSLEWRISSFCPSDVLPLLFFLPLLAFCPLMLIGRRGPFRFAGSFTSRFRLYNIPQSEKQTGEGTDRLVSAGQPMLPFTGEDEARADVCVLTGNGQT